MQQYNTILKKHKVSFMNKKNLLLLTLSLGMITGFVGCKKQPNETIIIEERTSEKRVSGPLSDRDVNWTKEDYN